MSNENKVITRMNYSNPHNDWSYVNENHVQLITEWNRKRILTTILTLAALLLAGIYFLWKYAETPESDLSYVKNQDQRQIELNVPHNQQKSVDRVLTADNYQPKFQDKGELEKQRHQTKRVPQISLPKLNDNNPPPVKKAKSQISKSLDLPLPEQIDKMVSQKKNNQKDEKDFVLEEENFRAQQKTKSIEAKSKVGELEPAAGREKKADYPGLSRVQLASNVFAREPVDKLSSKIVLGKDIIDRLYFFTELVNLNGKYVYHNWVFKGKSLFKRKINVGGFRWRASTNKQIIASMTGPWEVQLLDENEEVIHAISFDIVADADL